MITVESIDNSTRVTIPKEDVSPERLRSFLDWLRLEAITRHSQLTEEQADQMAEEIKAEWWAKNKDRFLRPTEQ
jgi:hypothetical protein